MQIQQAAPPASQSQSGTKFLIIDERYRQAIHQYLSQVYVNQNAPLYKQWLVSDDILLKHHGVIGIRKILSVVDNPPIQLIMDHGIHPILMQFMTQDQFPQLSLEATWAISNLCSGNSSQCAIIVQSGAIPVLVSMLLKPGVGIAQQACWALGNIGGDCPAYRDMILKTSAIYNLVTLFSNAQSQMSKTICWVVSNLARGSPIPKTQLVEIALPLLITGITAEWKDHDTITDCLWALSYHTENSKYRKVLHDKKTLLQIKSYLKSPSITHNMPAIRILGNFSMGSTQQTQAILNLDILSDLEILLTHNKKTLRRQTVWLLSNITAGSTSQVQKVLQRSELIDRVQQILVNDTEQCARQAGYFFSNMCYAGPPNNVVDLYVKKKIASSMMRIFQFLNGRLTFQCLEGLVTMIEAYSKLFGKNNVNEIAQEVSSNKNFKYIQQLAKNQDPKIKILAEKIVNEFNLCQNMEKMSLN